MNKQEFGYFLMALQSYYPGASICPTPQSAELWFEQLQDIPYNVATLALKKLVCTNKWAPSIAEIREAAATVYLPATKDWSEAWQDVITAIRQYGLYRADEAVESLEPLTREVVKRLGFTHLCISESVVADRANFREIYERLAERKSADALIPQNVKNLINEIKMLEDKKDES